MKRFSKYIKSKLFRFLWFPLLIFCAAALGIHLYPSTPSFQEITEQLFFEDITADTLSLHYTLTYPSRYSIHSDTAALPKYEKDTFVQTYSRIENTLALLQNINPCKLSKEEAYCYDLLTDHFTLQKKGFPFAYFEECFSPSSGIVSNFPILMAEYAFRTKQDVLDYFALLADTPAYFSSYCSFQRERAEKGYFLATPSLEETLQQCDTILTREALEENTHFLQITFRERLAPLVARNLISKKQALKWIQTNNTILKSIVLPAFQELKSSLLSLQTQYIPLQGLYRYPQGKEYYEWCVQKQVGCSLSITEILETLEKDYEKNLLLFRSLQEKITAYPDYTSYFAAPFPLNDKNEILDQLLQFSLEDFPTPSSYSNEPINTVIKSVSNCMEEYTSPAFYMIPAIDDLRQNTIYINNSSTPEGLDLFTTLAHEGYPGHLNQTVCYRLSAQQQDTPLIRHIMNYGGYVEGWAIYCEFYSYAYAARLYPEEAQEFYTLWHQLLVCDRKLQLALLSILDIKLHFYDDSLETAQELLYVYGITDQETISDIHRYILEEPGNYLKYYMGYLLLDQLKKKAETLAGSAFSDYDFHEFILNAGPSDFDNLEKRLQTDFSFHSRTLSYSANIGVDR